MDHIEGDSMQDLLDRGETFSTRVILLAASQVSDALAHVHDKGMVHRDIKPGNIMISGRGRISRGDHRLRPRDVRDFPRIGEGRHRHLSFM
jgi:serine/threonine-protein kinase